MSAMEQNLDRQNLGAVERVLKDKASGKEMDRNELKEMLVSSEELRFHVQHM